MWAESDIKLVWAKTYNLSPWFERVSTDCELKMEMDQQDLQAGLSWCQNSNSTTRSRSKKQNETGKVIEKDGFKTGIRFRIRLKNSRNILRVAIN